MNLWATYVVCVFVVGCSSPSAGTGTESISTQTGVNGSSTGVTTGSTTTITNTDGVSESETGCTCSRCPCSPIPRWVLRDKNGVVLNALVEPRCGGDALPEGKNCVNEFTLGADVDFPCVRIINYEGTHINLPYELTTGRIEFCSFNEVNDGATFSDEVYFYTTPDCQGSPHYYSPGIDEFRATQHVIYVEQELWYLSGTEKVVPEELWLNDVQDNNECITTNTLTVYPYRKVPGWVRYLLSNPPYTLSLEYG